MTRASHASGRFRDDIQGLRAVAVALVLLYHVWPGAVPGGYVGVDVFFVISGYLITGLLLREAERDERVSLGAFYARRITRLLPAATVTLAVVGLASIALLPRHRWQDIGAEIAASALYVENWQLLRKAVDYLASEGAASPVQHFWSLSVEEQFYIAWPLVIVAALALARRTGWQRRRVLGAALLGLTAASLACSIVLTARNPTPAYFSSLTRFWELGLGGLLSAGAGSRAVGPRRDLLVWPGLAAIGLAAAWFSTETAFPGHAALLPTVGAAAVILGGAGAGPAARLLGLAPLRYLGGTSYSLYLWHWPILVFYQARTRAEPGVAGGLAIVAASIAVAELSRRFIEDPPRRRAGPSRPPWRTLALGAGAAALSVGVGALLLARGRPAPQRAELSPADYPGAAALAPGFALRPAPVRPLPTDAFLDRGRAYGGRGRKRCIQEGEGTDVMECAYGPVDAPVTIALVGDSHAAHWEPAFERLAERRGWRVLGYMKDSCYFADVTLFYRGFGRDYTECDAWRAQLMTKLLAVHPDVVVVGQHPRPILTNQRKAGTAASIIAAALRRTWSELRASGIEVAVLRHTPIQSPRLLDCLSGADGSVETCSARRKTALAGGPFDQAVRDDPDVHVIDMTDLLCPGQRCPVVIGNILVYRDGSHMTASYARTLVPMLEARLLAAFPHLGAR